MNHLYSLKFTHDDVYNDSSILPSHCTGYIIRKDNVSITYSDEPSYNTIPAEHITSYLSMLRTGVKPLPTTSHNIDENTLYYEQCDINILCKMYNPLIHSLARNVHTSTERYFLLEDLLQEGYFIISLLYRQGYYIHGKLVKQVYVNRIRHLLRKEPTRWDVVSLTSPVANKNNDESLTLAETIADPRSNDFIDDLSDDNIIQQQRKQLLTVITPRQYEQFIREYRTNTVPTSMGKTIQHIRNELGLL